MRGLRLLETLWQELFVKSWWVWITFIVSFGLYEQGCYKLNREISELEQEIHLCSQKLESATASQEELRLQLSSLSDPAWIELVLIQGLGMVPEGYTKIYFQSEPTSCDSR